MPASAPVYAFKNAANRILYVVSTADITLTEAQGYGDPFNTLTVAQLTAAGVNSDAETVLLTGRVVSNTNVVTDYAASAAELQTAWKGRLADAYNIYQGGVVSGSRKDWWPSMRSGDNARRPLIATDRWAYQQVALGDLIADGSYLGTATDAQREVVIEHIATVLETLGETWYGVMVAQEGQSGGGNSALWAAGSVADGALLYSDIVAAAAAPYTRAPDGAFTALAGATIPTGFKPDTPTLR